MTDKFHLFVGRSQPPGQTCLVLAPAFLAIGLTTKSSKCWLFISGKSVLFSIATFCFFWSLSFSSQPKMYYSALLLAIDLTAAKTAPGCDWERATNHSCCWTEYAAHTRDTTSEEDKANTGAPIHSYHTLTKTHTKISRELPLQKNATHTQTATKEHRW